MRNSWRELIEVTIPGEARRRPNLIVHRDALAPDEWQREDGIPVTTPARTLLDLASVLSPFEVERCLHQSENRLTSPTSISDLLARHPRRRGAPALRAALKSLSGGSRSPAPTSKKSSSSSSMSAVCRGLRPMSASPWVMTLQVLGFDVIRVTDRALAEDPDGVERDLRSLLFP